MTDVGGMEEVYRARDTKLERQVAVKRLSTWPGSNVKPSC